MSGRNARGVLVRSPVLVVAVGLVIALVLVLVLNTSPEKTELGLREALR
jgi:hypothetical protein